MTFQFYAKITMRILGDGLDLEQVKSLFPKMELYQVQLLATYHCNKEYAVGDDRGGSIIKTKIKLWNCNFFSPPDD